MAYYVKRYLDGRRRVVRVRDGIGEALRGLLGKLKDVIGRAIAFCVSRLQGAGVGRKIASLLQKALDRLRGSAKEAIAAENGNGNLGPARKNLLEALKGIQKAKEEAEKSNLPAEIQIGIKSPIENATRLMEAISHDFSLQRVVEKANSLQQKPRPLALTYDPRVVSPIIPGNIPVQRDPFKTLLINRVGQIPSNGTNGIREMIMNVVSRAANTGEMNSAARQIGSIAKSEVDKIKASLGGMNRLHLPEGERKAFNNKINSVKKYSEAVTEVLRKLSGHVGDVIPRGTELFEKKVILRPPKSSPDYYSWQNMRQGRLPF